MGGIKPAYISRVSNAKVLHAIGQRQLTKTLEKRQLLLYGEVARQGGRAGQRELAQQTGALQPGHLALHVLPHLVPRLVRQPAQQAGEAAVGGEGVPGQAQSGAALRPALPALQPALVPRHAPAQPRPAPLAPDVIKGLGGFGVGWCQWRVLYVQW